MTYTFLTRKNWEKKSCNAISQMMKHKTAVIETGDQFPADTEMVIRWGCTANSPVKKIINKPPAIHLVSNKADFRKLLREHAPETIPDTWISYDPIISLFKKPLELPVVVRPHEHERGKDFFVCKEYEDFEKAVEKVGDNFYVSKFYDKKKEFRVFVVQGRVICLVEKKPNNGQLNAWGLAANWINYKWGDWPVEAVRVALQAHKYSGLHASASDIILTKEGFYKLCEVNSAPELGGDYYARKYAEAFDWAIDNTWDNIPTDMTKDDWKHLGHPSLSNKVVVEQ